MIPFFDHTPAAPKICGITTPDDALGCIEAGAGALGFNFYPLSPRSISVNGDLLWIAKLKADYPDIALVAVVVNPEKALLKHLLAAGCFDAVQFHGDEKPEFCAAEGAAFGIWIKALRVRSEADLATAPNYETTFLLLDAAVPGSYGGSGKTTEWGLASKFISENPRQRVLLAGGLTPENVAEAVARVRPHAVDVASGVESSPGRKDPVKVREFIAKAIGAEC